MRQFQVRRTKKKLLESRYESWKTINKLVSKTQVKPTELVDGNDIQLVEDGKIQCPRDGQAYYGSESGTKVVGLYPYYKSDSTKKLVRMSGTNLQYYNAGSWSNITGATYTSNLNANGVMAYDRLYLGNATDNLSYYDGSAIQTFTEISAPTAPTVTRTGTGGTYTFSYKICAVTANGETTPSAAGSTTLNQSSLDSSNYMTISWSAVASAIGYNLYGRKDGAWYFMLYLEGNGSVSYIDKASVTPNEAIIPPEGNSTGGQKGNLLSVYKDSLFVAGDTANPSRLYYSGGGDKINDFTVGGGGGFIDISKNDGQKITGMIVFKDSLIIFKERSTYKFAFTTSGLPQVEQVNPAVGCIAPRSIVAVENDIFFAGEDGVYTMGNEAGFAFDVLRTNELSVPIRPTYETIDPAYIQNISAVYAKKNGQNLVIFSYTEQGSTTNNKAMVYDRQRLGWLPTWTNIKANCWAVYKDSTGERCILYGDDSSGYVKEILTGTDDFGTQIDANFELRSESFKTGTNHYKNLSMIDLLLRNPTGTIILKVIVDGVTTAKTVNLTTIQPSINFGHFVLGRFLLGESYGTGAVASSDENLLRTLKNLGLNEARAYGLRFENNSSGRFTLLLAAMTAKPRSDKYRQQENYVTQ
jgi:hypothetical protein